MGSMRSPNLPASPGFGLQAHTTASDMVPHVRKAGKNMQSLIRDGKEGGGNS